MRTWYAVFGTHVNLEHIDGWKKHWRLTLYPVHWADDMRPYGRLGQKRGSSILRHLLVVPGRFAKTGKKKENAEIQQYSLISRLQRVWEEKEPRASSVSNITLCIWGKNNGTFTYKSFYFAASLWLIVWSHVKGFMKPVALIKIEIALNTHTQHTLLGWCAIKRIMNINTFHCQGTQNSCGAFHYLRFNSVSF